MWVIKDLPVGYLGKASSLFSNPLVVYIFGCPINIKNEKRFLMFSPGSSLQNLLTLVLSKTNTSLMLQFSFIYLLSVHFPSHTDLQAWREFSA